MTAPAERPDLAAPSTLSSLLALANSPAESAVEYVIGGLELGAAEREWAAWLVAETAMQITCGVSPVLDRWRARRDGGPPEVGSALETVKTYVVNVLSILGARNRGPRGGDRRAARARPLNARLTGARRLSPRGRRWC